MASAWHDFCDRLKALGDVVEGDGFPDDDRGRAEGQRHLGRLAVFALQWAVESSDPDFPAFLRYDDDLVKWGGPNTDNHYLRAKVDPRGTYRLTADVAGVRQMIISTPEGDMQLDRYRVFEERNLSQLDVDADGRLEVLLSPEPQDRNWIPLHPEVDHVLVRQYVSDWDHDAVADLHIERIGNEGAAPGPLSTPAMAARLDEAATWVERSVVYWNEYMRRSRERLGANVLSAPNCPPGGARDILYGGGWWELAADEALVVEFDAPQADYWSIQLYAPTWFESLDIANRISSLSGHQARVDADGRVRVVVAHDDPGVPNWLDTERRPTGMVSYRWVWSSTAPVPTTRVVPVGDVAGALPAGTPTVTPEERRQEVARRRAAVARRFRR